MKQTGIVIKTDGNKALVKIQRSAACGDTCGNCTICENKEKTQWVLNLASASVGDRVTMELKGSSFMLMAFTAYILPLIFALGISFLAEKFFERAVADAVFVCAVAVGIIIAVVLGKTVFIGERFQSRITEVNNQE